MTVKKINEIYVDYFQKSKVFLYPILDIKKGTSVTPIETFISWGDITVKDKKLICLYYLRDDAEFVEYEDKYLLKNPLFQEYKELDDNKAIYIFDLNSYSKDFEYFIDGKYSKFSKKLKDRIRDSYGATSANYTYIKSYLYPEEYYQTYANLLCTDDYDVSKMKTILSEVGELCSKPDIEKEHLKLSIKSLDLKKL